MADQAALRDPNREGCPEWGRPSAENLMVMRQTADRLFGHDAYEFSVLAAGRHQMPLSTIGAILGSHVGVGLEDSRSLGGG
ncbi:3-keto-5-aminohexanoate cleavage protein [Paracoccus angustae]|uniref:3-keto-5-aminohexanoate cleavage protein n=1 Tax=Paracoccus angustae TaxID=1671480 RepID=A0ABV7TYH0_9RHOB